MEFITQRLSKWWLLFAKSKDGLSPDEAKRLFFQFRKKDVMKPEEPEPSGDAPGPERGRAAGDLSTQMASFMRETSTKLDRIENDIDYLKKQVDLILKKID
jgi:hypothetical protein